MSSIGATNEREFEQMLEQSIMNGAVSPQTIREKLSQNYGRYMAMYRTGSKKGSKDPKLVKKIDKKETKKAKGKKAGSNDPVVFYDLDHSVSEIDESDEKLKEIKDLYENLSKEAMVQENHDYVVTPKQEKKDKVLFSALEMMKVSFVPSVASKMRRKGNSVPGDQVIALEQILGISMFMNTLAKKKPEEFSTIGEEVSDWLSAIPTENQNVLRPFVRVPKLLKGFFREPEIRKKSTA